MSYAEKIINELVERGDFVSTGVFCDVTPVSEDAREVIKKLECIPEENLRKVYDSLSLIIYNMSQPYTVDKMLKEAAKLGYLKFNPYIKENEYGSPTLVLKYNRFVHLFRGYHYQVSYTEDGIGEYQSGSVRVDFISTMFSHNEDCKLHQCLYYMNLIAACYGIDSFMKTLENNPEVIDEFIKLSVKREIPNFSLTYAELKQMLSVKSRDVNELPEYTFRVPHSDTMDDCRINIYKADSYSSRMIGIEYGVDGTTKEALFKFPDFEDTVGIESYVEYWGYEEDEVHEMAAAIYNSSEVLISLIVYALNTVGFVSNFMVTYPIIKSIEQIKAINSNDVIEFKTLNAVYTLDFVRK